LAYRYLGNKTRIADWIADEVFAVLGAKGAIADPMCGTATMAERFAQRGYAVTASDELLFPTLHAKARLLDLSDEDFKPVVGSYSEAVQLLNSANPTRGYFWSEFSDEGTPSNGSRPRMYFTGANAAKIDAVRGLLQAWRSDGMNENALDRLLHDLLLAVNEVANIAGTYGYYRSSWNKASLRPLRVVASPVHSFTKQHAVLRGKVEDLATSFAVDAVYLDPPYTKRQYGGNYHILETIARGDEPDPVGEGGLRDWYSNSSDFCFKRKAPAALSSTLQSLPSRYVFMSYSEDGVMSTDTIQEILTSFGNVEIHHQALQRFRSNGGKAGPVMEQLYILEKV